MLGHGTELLGNGFKSDLIGHDFQWGGMTLSFDSAVISDVAIREVTQSIISHCMHCS